MTVRGLLLKRLTNDSCSRLYTGNTVLTPESGIASRPRRGINLWTSRSETRLRETGMGSPPFPFKSAGCGR